MKRVRFPIVVKRGSCAVKIYRDRKPEGTYYRVAYHLGGKRHRLNFRSQGGDQRSRSESITVVSGRRGRRTAFWTRPARLRPCARCGETIRSAAGRRCHRVQRGTETS